MSASPRKRGRCDRLPHVTEYSRDPVENPGALPRYDTALEARRNTGPPAPRTLERLLVALSVLDLPGITRLRGRERALALRRAPR